jgi:general secretion pathway protein B
MSLILEALRKSEAERRRGMAPDVAMELPPTPASRPRPLAAWLLPALVVAVLLVLAGWWARREPAKSTSPQAAIEASTDTLPAATDSVPAEMSRIEPQPAAPTLASVQEPEIRTPVVPTPSPAAAALSKPAPASTAAPTPSVAATRPTPIQPMPIQPAPARPLPPQASDISTDTSMLPPIKLSMHMWDDVPSKRFVILNGQRMAEGDHYGAITVIAIERNGVVVESNSSRARVPLP